MRLTADAKLLEVDLPSAMLKSASASTFLPEEEASICPLLANTKGSSPPLTFGHPLTAPADDATNAAVNIAHKAAKVETSSSSGVSSGLGIGIGLTDTATTIMFNNHAYQYLQKKTGMEQNVNGLNGNLNLPDDTPSFVSWNWPLIRKCTFFMFMAILLGICAIVVALVITLPKVCNPKTSWYHGSVFYEIFPASFQDSNQDGFGDLRGILDRVDYLSSMGISAVRLNSIFPSERYPEDYANATSLTEIAPIIGSANDLRVLCETLHRHNISLLLDLPTYPLLKELEPIQSIGVLMNGNDLHDEATTMTNASALKSDNYVVNVMRQWLDLGVDGFFLKGLEHYAHDANLLENMAMWRRTVGDDKVLIIGESILHEMSVDRSIALLENVHLVDVHLDVMNGTKDMQQQIRQVLANDYRVWIQWSIGGVDDEQRITRGTRDGNATLAATLMQLMLPGTPNIFYGDEIALENVADPLNQHGETRHLHHLSTMKWPNASWRFTSQHILPWLPEAMARAPESVRIVSELIRLRDRSPSIYKNAICKTDAILSNTQIRNSRDDILIVERVYPRRNSFVSISNFGMQNVSMDMTSMYYSGHILLTNTTDTKVYFQDFKIGPMETIIVKLDK